VSVPVSLDRLRDEVARFGPTPYLLTVGAEGRAHAVAVAATFDGDELVVRGGRRTVANAIDRPAIVLLWPPHEPDGYSLIVDGDAHVTTGPDGPGIAITPTTAVLHRPAPRPEGTTSSCGSDCVRL
jgi:hypothetical protein